MMKESAILINTGRGPLINEQDLIEALRSNTIRGACLDVLTNEPPVKKSELFELDNCIMTPRMSPISLLQVLNPLLDSLLYNFITNLPKHVT